MLTCRPRLSKKFAVRCIECCRPISDKEKTAQSSAQNKQLMEQSPKITGSQNWGSSGLFLKTDGSLSINELKHNGEITQPCYTPVLFQVG